MTAVNSAASLGPLAWSIAADDILRALWPTDMPARDIARQISDVTSPARRVTAVYNRAHTLGLPPKKRGGDRRSQSKQPPRPNYVKLCLACRSEFRTPHRFTFLCSKCSNDPFRETGNDYSL